MKKLIFAVVATLFAQQSYAACTGTLVTDAQTALSGNTFHGSEVGGTDTWNERHQAGGTLCEIAQGPSDAVDPSHNVGTWSASTTDGSVTYNYAGGSSYTFYLYENGGTHYYCTNGDGTGTDVASGTIDSASCTAQHTD